jgi:hypothetical protein
MAGFEQTARKSTVMAQDRETPAESPQQAYPPDQSDTQTAAARFLEVELEASRASRAAAMRYVELELEASRATHAAAMKYLQLVLGASHDGHAEQTEEAPPMDWSVMLDAETTKMGWSDLHISQKAAGSEKRKATREESP